MFEFFLMGLGISSEPNAMPMEMVKPAEQVVFLMEYQKQNKPLWVIDQDDFLEKESKVQ